MASPKTLLPILLGGAIGLGGLLQGLHWRASANRVGNADLEDQLRLATEENEMLKRENESLRSLAQGGGELAVPRELIERAEKEFGLRFLSNPVVHRIAVEELRDRIAAAMESRMGPSGIEDRQEAWRWIGWLSENDDLLAMLTAVRSTGARTWFDDVTGEAWVTDRFDVNSIPDQAALLKAIVRILLHQNFPPPPSYPGDDAARAREALHQGAAVGSEARFFAANARAIGFMPMKENTEAQQLFASLPDFIKGLTTFPAMEGKGLADTLHVQGNDKFHEAFRSPPQSTRAILTPQENQPNAEPLELPAMPEEPYLSECAGQLGLKLWLEPSPDAGEISSAWKNDRYALIPDGEASSAVIWDIELQSKEAADLLENAAKLRIAGKKESSSEDGVTHNDSSAEKRLLKITRPSATRVRFLNTATPELADKLD